MTPISVQLYSLREASEQNFDAVLEELSALGYAGVARNAVELTVAFLLGGLVLVGIARALTR